MKHVIVTGGSKGIGASAVRALLEADYYVSTCSRRRTESITAVENDPAFADRFHYEELDMAAPDRFDAFLDSCESKGGPVFGLVNNAGIAMAGVLATFPLVDVERVVKINLVGPIAMARVAIRRFIKNRKGGRLINISSIIGTRGYSGLATYSASKAGLDGLTRALAREVGRIGVTVNSIAPGYVRTDMSATLTQGQMDQIIRRTPLGRLSEAADIMGLLLFLLSDRAGFITGQVIQVDGGISC